MEKIVWRIRINKEIRNLFRETYLISEIKKGRKR